MKIDHPFQNIIGNEDSLICDHYEITNMVNMRDNERILEGCFSKLQAERNLSIMQRRTACWVKVVKKIVYSGEN